MIFRLIWHISAQNTDRQERIIIRYDMKAEERV
jgi:hypothetical protein